MHRTAVHSTAASLFLAFLLTSSVSAQATDAPASTRTDNAVTNIALYQEMAVACLGELPTTVDTILVQAPERMPFVRSALVESWQAHGVSVFLSDAEVSAPRLAYDVEEASVSYDRRRNAVSRRVHLALRYTLAARDGRILADDRCEDVRSDLIRRADVEAVEAEAYGETQGELPRGGWFRRVLEPAVVTAASAITVYLFFVLRSREGEDS